MNINDLWSEYLYQNFRYASPPRHTQAPGFRALGLRKKEREMAKETTYAGKLGDWQRLLAPLEANEGSLPHLEVLRGKLAAFASQVVEIHQAQAAQKALKQEMSRQLKGAISAGDRLATVLRQVLKEHYGIRAEKLSEFGVQPFRGRPRKAKPAPGAPQGSGSPQPHETPKASADPTL
jgi:hypothetical protein